MDFEWTEEQRTYRDAIIRFAQRELTDDLIRRDGEGLFSRDAWKKCAQMGIQGLLSESVRRHPVKTAMIYVTGRAWHTPRWRSRRTAGPAWSRLDTKR